MRDIIINREKNEVIMTSKFSKKADDPRTEEFRLLQEVKAMLEEDMLSIMGKGYNKSSLRDGSFKYEWRINATSTGYSNNGISSRKYSGVKKVDIYTKNGKVVEIKPHNV